ncbi:hypothetical protein B1813_18855 [Saccharomonospora piscinae]|uniref:AAA domain-containing protein n=1 Tax=Saccharomonospora piscinae TaxID=687388 RepID=A0A1V8ZYE6_SACPI|nr:hypothetical protein [Saccharomonospora piscinae]OQO89902.1 hypothetical protein B1813_18855 [Saccharomonospora piscinae]
MSIRTRKPTGQVPWPLLLVEGEEKAGKSWMVAELTASDRIGRKLWIELGSEGTADQYGAIPGADYEIVEHNGTWQGLVQAIADATAAAREAQEAGEPPVMLAVDSATAEWDLLKTIAEQRARASKYGRKILADDPNADVPIDRNHWTHVTELHYEHFLEPLKHFPGIAVVTARGKEVSSTDANGKPVPNSREYKVEGQKNLGFDCHAWVRLSRSGPPTVVGMRSVDHPIRPGRDKPVQDPDLSLERFIFDILGCDPAKAQTVQAPVRSELDEAKRDLWSAAQEMNWTAEKLAQGFAEENDGQDLQTATVEQLNAYRDFLRLCLAQPDEGGDQ